MAIALLFAFIITPIVEIAVFIEVGGEIGLWPTIAIVIITAIVGTTLLRLQGLATLRRAQENLARNQFPMREVFDGLCLLFAGALLLTPGFVTDAVGLLLFVPAIRLALRRLIWRYLQRSGEASIWVQADMPPPRPDREPGTIDAEYEEIPSDDDSTRNRRNSGN